MECVERKWVEKHAWEVAGSAPLPLGWATWLWLKNGPLILIPSVLYLQQLVFIRYICHMAIVGTEIAEQDDTKTISATTETILQSLQY